MNLDMTYKKPIKVNKNLSIYSLFLNPFSLLALTFFFISFAYSLGWSGLFLPLTIDTKIFLTVLVLLSLLLAILFNNKHFKRINNSINLLETNKEITPIRYEILIIISFFVLEVLYNGYIPVFRIVSAIEETDYRNFSIPILHIFYLTYMNYVFLKRSSNFIFLNSKVSLLPMFLIIFIQLMLVSRGSIVFLIFCFINMYLMKGTFSLKRIIKLLVPVFLLFYLFGVVGDVRTNAQIGRQDAFNVEVLARATLAEGPIVENENLLPTYWAYLYVSSPLGNFQNTISSTEVTKNNYVDLVYYEFLPDIINRNLSGILDKEEFVSNVERVIPFLTVATFAGDSYGFMGWIGVVMITFLLLISPPIILNLTGNYNYHLQASVINTLMILSGFTNIFPYTNFSLVVLLLIFSSRISLRYK